MLWTRASSSIIMESYAVEFAEKIEQEEFWLEWVVHKMRQETQAELAFCSTFSTISSSNLQSNLLYFYTTFQLISSYQVRLEMLQETLGSASWASWDNFIPWNLVYIYVSFKREKRGVLGFAKIVHILA